MNIVYIVPGSGQTFYCENCFRDFSLISGLRAVGHTVTIVPLYLPVNVEEGAEHSMGPLFFGAVRLYLEEKYPVIKHLPGSLRKKLDAPALLRFAATRAGSTRAAGNEKLTLTILEGENGPQAQEFERLAVWVVGHVKPEAVIVSNMLLLGVGESIHARMQIPVFCFAQDEDTWVNGCAPRYRDAIWDTIARHDRFVIGFFSLSNWYTRKILPFVKLPPERFTLLRFGVNPDNYPMAPHTSAVPMLGYLSRLHRANGFHVLAEAFHVFTQKNGNHSLELSLCGGSTADDRQKIKHSLEKTRKGRHVLVEPRFGLSDRTRFLAGLSVLSVPCPEPIAYGTFIIEALASGIPVVQPDIGGFSEIAAQTEGVYLYTPNNIDALADALADICSDRQKLKMLGIQARTLIREEFTHTRMAREVTGAMARSH